jgi:hypothetical protein
MKIGTSLGKCVKDLLNGVVEYDDVLFVITNTKADNLGDLEHIIAQYHEERWRKDYDISNHSLDNAIIIATKLYKDGKLHQPRLVKVGNWGLGHSLRDTWYDIMPSEKSSSESVKAAWNHYKFLARLND